MVEFPSYPVERRTLAQPWFWPERRSASVAVRLIDWDDRISFGQQASCFVLSFVLHGLLLTGHWHFLSFRPSNSAIEIDLTSPYEIVPPNIAAMAKPVRKGTMSASSSPAIRDSPSMTAGNDEKNRTGSLTGVDEEGAEVALVSLTAIPQLLNANDVQSILRKYYPEAERQAGHEGRVILDLHVDTAGNVIRGDIIVSAGQAFDQSALKITSLLKFQPARVGDRPVPVKLRQTIIFRLD